MLATLTNKVSRGASVYRPRSPTRTALYELLAARFDYFEAIYPERFSKSHGFYRPVISRVVHNYLWCGNLTQGGARVRCPDCHHEYLLAFSCRGRWFCPSCHEKKVVQFGEQLRENILYLLPHRQYVFSIPIILRKLFLYNRKLLSTLCKATADSLRIFLRTATGLKDGIVGAVMPKTSLKPLAELFRARLLKLLLKEEVIDDSFVAMLMKWKHTSGFNVNNSVRIARGDEKGITALALYLIRYYGWYSNRMRGERRKAEDESCAEEQEREAVDISKLTMVDVAGYRPRRIPPPLWPECIKKV